MIVLAGETEYQDKVKDFLRRSGYAEERVVTHLIAGAMTAPSRSHLEDWLINRPAATVDIEDLMGKSTTSYNELVARIKTVDTNTGGKWYIHDYRPLWFWDHFLKLAPGAEVVAIVSSEDNGYYQSIKNFFDTRLPADSKIIDKSPTQGEFKELLGLKPKAIKK